MRLRKLKKGLAMLLTAAMVVGLVPGMGTLQVSAAESTEPQPTDEASVTINGETLYYATLEEAFSAADGKTATITMLNDAECTAKSGVPISVMNKSNITLNMNGKTLSGQATGICGIITLATGSLSVQGPGTMKSTNQCLNCQSKNAKMTVENITFDVSEAYYGVYVLSSNTVTLNNVQITGTASKYAVYLCDRGNMTINNVSATGIGYCDVYYNSSGTLKINGGTFDKISVESGNSGGITSVSQLLGEGCTYRHMDKIWATADELNALEISNVTVEKIPLTINPQAETSWYYNSAEHSLQMNAVPTTENNAITYEWYDGETKLECVSDAYTIPKTMSAGNYNYTCKATCDGWTLSHEFTYTIEKADDVPNPPNELYGCIGAKLSTVSLENYEGWSWDNPGLALTENAENITVTASYNGADKDNYKNITAVDVTINLRPHNHTNGFCEYCGGIAPAQLVGGENHPELIGTHDGYYAIENAGQLYWFAQQVNDGNTGINAVLTDDIDLSSKTFTSIGAEETKAFSGIFDGNGHKITVNQSGSEYVAIFGYIGACTIKNLTVTGTINTTEKYAAGIAIKKLGDETTANIENCISDVTIVSSVSGDGTHGGIIGNVDGTVNINNCAFTGKMEGSATTSCGGIIGWTQGTANITNSYVSASFDISSASGNIVSRKGSSATVTVTNCYYLNALNATQGSITQKTEEQFANGEVAYLLSQGTDGSVWGQKLGKNGDAYPVLKKERDEGNTVYQNETYASCEGNPGEPTYSYSNTEEDPVYADHKDVNEDGKCDTCSKYMDNIGARLVGHSLTLDGSVGVNFYMELSSEVISDNSAYMEFTLPGGKTSTVKVSEAPTEVISGTTYYKFKCQVNATAMTDTITAQLKSKVGNSKIYEYTVKEYADYLFAHKDENTEFAAAAALIEAMVNYGSYAQIYADYNADKLAVGDKENLKSVNDVTLDAYTYTPNENEIKVQFAGANLSLLSTTTLRMYFKITNVEAESVTFTYGGGKALEKTQSGDYYYVELVGIPANRLDNDCVVTVNDGTNSFNVTYTPMAYCANIINRETTETRTESLKNLIKALVMYNREADAYINNENQ